MDLKKFVLLVRIIFIKINELERLHTGTPPESTKGNIK
jgi:hypothetical protein